MLEMWPNEQECSLPATHSKACFRNAEYGLFLTIEYTVFKNDDNGLNYFTVSKFLKLLGLKLVSELSLIKCEQCVAVCSMPTDIQQKCTPKANHGPEAQTVNNPNIHNQERVEK